MKKTEVLIIGAGPAGLSAAMQVLNAGLSVTLIDRSEKVGGQLTKQTHMFFGSEKQYASKRGIDILDILFDKIKDNKNLTVIQEATVVSMYSDRVIAYVKDDKYTKLQADAIIIATGASEKTLPFENNDLPGVYAAGAVQTLMNVYGVKPGDRVVMVGSGNIGLIVSYQLMQAGVKVPMLLEAADTIGGYLVHASKIRRLGVDLRMKTSVKRAIGETEVEAAEIWQLDDNWQGIEGTEEIVPCDTICLSVGLAPLTELLQQAGAEVIYVQELGGFVPKINKSYQTTLKHVYACGDVAGIEEASSAMISGELAGLSLLKDLGKAPLDYDKITANLRKDLDHLRDGPHGEKIRKGLTKLGVNL